MFIHPQPSLKTLNRHYSPGLYYSYKKEITGLSGLISRFRSYLIKHYYKPTLVSRLFSAIVKGVPAIPHKPTHKLPKILDVGCGSGATLALLKLEGWDVYGLEIDKVAVKIAAERGLKNVKQGGFEQIANYPNNYFDCIRLYHVIEHLPDPQRCLRLIYKKLKSGGEVLLGTPNSDSVVSHVFGKFWYNLDTPRHLYVFSPSTLSKMVSNEGFGGVSITYCSSDGLGRSIIYALNAICNIKMDTNKFTVLFFVLYPIEWILDKLERGDIITLRAVKNYA